MSTVLFCLFFADEVSSSLQEYRSQLVYIDLGFNALWSLFFFIAFCWTTNAYTAGDSTCFASTKFTRMKECKDLDKKACFTDANLQAAGTGIAFSFFCTILFGVLCFFSYRQMTHGRGGGTLHIPAYSRTHEVQLLLCFILCDRLLHGEHARPLQLSSRTIKNTSGQLTQTLLAGWMSTSPQLATRPWKKTATWLPNGTTTKAEESKKNHESGLWTHHELIAHLHLSRRREATRLGRGWWGERTLKNFIMFTCAYPIVGVVGHACLDALVEMWMDVRERQLRMIT
jgi:hypothetical protein